MIIMEETLLDLEPGVQGMLAAAGVMVTTALLVGGALRVVLIGF